MVKPEQVAQPAGGTSILVGPRPSSHDPGRGNAPYPAEAAAATLGMSVWCVWCRLYWLAWGEISISRVCLSAFPQVPHGTWAVLYVAAPHTAPLDPIVCVCGLVSIVRGGRKWCSRWGGEMGMPLIHPAVGICCCCFSTAQNRHRTLRTCSSAKGRAKRLRLCMAWHGMAGCLVCMARWGGQILPRASLRGSWCFMPSSRHPVLSGLLDSTSMVGKQNSIDGRARQAALLLGNHPPVCLVPSPNFPVPPKRRRWC